MSLMVVHGHSSRSFQLTSLASCSIYVQRSQTKLWYDIICFSYDFDKYLTLFLNIPVHVSWRNVKE